MKRREERGEQEEEAHLAGAELATGRREGEMAAAAAAREESLPNVRRLGNRDRAMWTCGASDGSGLRTQIQSVAFSESIQRLTGFVSHFHRTTHASTWPFALSHALTLGAQG